MITANNLNKLIELEKQFSYGGSLYNLLHELSFNTDIDILDKNVIQELANFVHTSKDKISKMKKKWDDKIKEQLQKAMKRY